MPTAPTADELLQLPIVEAALDQAWSDSLPHDPANRHEEVGWIYMDVSSGGILIERAAAGTRRRLQLKHPKLHLMHVVVAKFHTHPDPSDERWDPGPSEEDIRRDNFHGVPDLIMSDSGMFTSGPEQRRGRLSGPHGFPIEVGERR